MKMPEKIALANLPTRIEKLERLSGELGKNIWIKRDDQTGTEVSGNKIRKLEYAVKEALDSGCNHLITCGGIQSNHARATAAVAAKLGLGCSLVLRGDETADREGNLFLDTIMGAEVTFITADQYKDSRAEIMLGISQSLGEQGVKAYIIPEGASNGIGSFGYLNAYDEIIEQEKSMGIVFDAIVVTVGSAGTFTGLIAGNTMHGGKKDVVGINIAATADHFRVVTGNLLTEMEGIADFPGSGSNHEFKIIDGYQGLGYALSKDDELETISWIARLEGLVLDPVYTGKAMHGLVREIGKGNFDGYDNILFIHTGGIFGWTREVSGRI